MSQANPPDTTKDRMARVKAEQSYGAACRRLERDGYDSVKNAHRRLQVIANERLLPLAEVAKAKRSGKALAQFCDTHSISFMWIMYGDLKELLRTVRDARSVTPEMEQKQADEVGQLFKRLSAHDRNRMLNGLRNMTGAKP